MENQSKYIMIERNKFAALVKAHRKCLQILSILTYAYTVKEVQLTFTLEEICELLQMTREEVETQRQKGYIRFSVQNGITVYEITDILRLKNTISSNVTFASSNASSITASIVSICRLDATSGTTPPNFLCSAICVFITLDKTSLPSFTTAAAVSSHELSIPSISTLSLLTRFKAFRHYPSVLTVITVISFPLTYYIKTVFLVKPLGRYVTFADFKS